MLRAGLIWEEHQLLRAVPLVVHIGEELQAAPLRLADGVILLPAPCTTRRPGRDLTEWMDMAATPPDTIRIGLAHGAVQSFSEDGGAGDVIAPDRAGRAGLDYLALGDWHGQMRIGPRTWYSGAPEPDRFKHDASGRALLVTIPAAGAEPTVEPVETGAFDWRTLALDCLAGDDPSAHLAALLPAGPSRRQTLIRILATGRTRPPARARLEADLKAIAPEFALLQLEAQKLVTECESEDLDQIDRAGALRQAADMLLAECRDEDRSSSEREVAREALMRLFSYCAAAA